MLKFKQISVIRSIAFKGRLSRHFASAADFEKAQKDLMSLSQSPDNEVKLKLYGLYKQASNGACNVAKPGMMDFVGRAKWQAWKDVGDISMEAAGDDYVSLVQSLLRADSGKSGERSAGTSTADPSAPIQVTRENGVCTVMYNRPAKKNAITIDMYKDITKIFNEIATDDSLKIAVIAGAGDYFSSGNDLSNFSAALTPGADLPTVARENSVVLLEFVAALVNFPKPLVGLVNGPAIGIGATQLGLCDVLYASPQATLLTPMVALGQCPEGCSSYTFPRAFGAAKAAEMLLGGVTISAAEAYKAGFYAEIFPHSSFMEEANVKVRNLASQPRLALAQSKLLLRAVDRDILLETNRRECDALSKLWIGEECINAVAKFFSKN